jgi:quercetin dioxygenase-like cupin family protein
MVLISLCQVAKFTGITTILFNIILKEDVQMGAIKRSELIPKVIAPGRTRYIAYTEHLMMVVMDFHDGPTSEPDPPHSHPHEQVSYVVSGEINFFMNNEATRLGPEDIFTVPPHVPHCIQLLTPHVRLVDTFSPIREDFLK